MEKRVSKILTQFDAIVEEKNNLRDNLESLFTNVFRCVERIKNQSEISEQKNVLSYELEVLKTLNEINFEVERLITSNPLPEVKSPVIIEQKQEPSSSLHHAEIHTYVPRNDLCNIEKHGSNYCQTNGISDSGTNLPESDIQCLRNTLKLVGEKLGLNKQSISSIKDFYDKPSTSSQRDCYLNASAATPSESNIENFEIPEKDTNTKYKEEPSCREDIFAQVEPTYISTIRVEDISDKENESIIFEDEETDVENTTVIEVSSSSQLSVDEDIDDVSAQLHIDENISQDSPAPSGILINENQSAFDCQVPKVEIELEEHKFEEDEDTIDSLKSLVVTSNPTNVLSTALDKLKHLHCDKPTLLDVEPLHLPNIMLKPTKIECPNIMLKPTKIECSSINIQRATDGSKKKRNKKKKNGNNGDDIQYVLKEKTPPKIGDECAFSHVESPSEFYIHIVDHESALIDMITDQINEYFQDTDSEYNIKEMAHTAIGRYCFVFILEYNGWYRAEVINWFLDKKTDEVLVLLVDFGNKRLTSYKHLRKMLEEIAKIPMLAVKCHFPLMYPPGSTALEKKTEWPPETIDAMFNLSGLLQLNEKSNKVFKIVFAQYCTELNSVAIDLFNVENEPDEITVGQLLLDFRLCEQIIDSIGEGDTSLEEFLQDVDTLENATNINEAIMEYNPKDEARICRFTKPDGTCYKGNNCKLEHIALPKDGFTTDKDPVFKEAMYDLILPLHNEAVTILITGYIDICNFFAQIVRTPHREKKYILDKDFFILLEDMNSSKVIRTYEPLQVLPAVGEIVMVKHNLSKKWLRAVVRDRIVDKNDDVQIFTVDFGDYLKVKLSELRKIKPNFLKLPFQAVNCYIGDYKFKKNCAHAEAKAFFFKNLYFTNFIAYSLSSSLPLKIRLQSMNGFDIGKELHKHGFAEKRLYDSNPRDNCIVML